MAAALQISSTVNAAKLSPQYAETGRIHIPDIMDLDGANQLLQALEAFEGWNLVFNSGSRHIDVYAEQLALMSEAQIREAHRIADTGATSGFQYIFKNYPIYDAYHEGICLTPFDKIYDFLNSHTTLDLARTVTGHSDIAFADAQLTKFEAGHFLTTHDDNVDGKDRRAAFVLNLTPDWRTDWGGILQFVGQDGHLEGGFTPCFNALNIFSIPKPHAVSQVSSFASGARYSVTGWFRAGKDPRKS